MLIFIRVDKTIRLTQGSQSLDPVECEWGEDEGQDSPSQQKDSEIYLAWNAKDNWYTVTDSFQFCDETDIAVHLIHTMTAPPFSPQVQQQFIGL